MKRLILLLVILVGSAIGQGVRVDVPPILNPRGTPIPNPNISLCTGTATVTGSSCSPATAQSYTDITLVTQCAVGSPVVLPGSNTCQATGDSLGNVGFWLQSGTYIYCVTAPGVTGKCYFITAATSGNAARIMVDQLTGSDPGVKLATCLTLLPAAGGICDASNIQGANVAATFNMNKSGVEIILGPGAWVFAGSPGINWTAHGSSMHPLTTFDAVILYTSSATADLIAMSAGGFNHFYDFGTASTVARTAGAAIHVTSSQYNNFERMILYPTFDGMFFDTGAGINTVQKAAISGQAGSGNAWHCPIKTGGVATGTVSGNLFLGISGSSNGPGATDAQVCFQDGTDTTWLTDSQLVANVGGNDAVGIHLELVNAGNPPSAIFVTNTDIEGGPTKAGVVIDTCQSCAFTAVNSNSSLRGASITGGTDVSWVGGEAYLNQQEGMRITGGTDLTVANMRFSNNSQAANNTSDDVFIAANTTGFKFIGNTFKKLGAPANLPKWNLEIAAGTSNNYSIIGNTFVGDNGTGNLTDGGTGTAKTILNSGLSPFNLGTSDVLTTGNITANVNGAKIGFGGDLAAARTTSTAVVFLGDNTVFIDRGVTTANVVTLGGSASLPFSAPGYDTNSNCQLGGAAGTTSPAACGSAAAGMIAVPASQTSYTVNTTVVGTNSEIIVQQITDNSGLPSSPACNAGVTAPIQSARVAGTSFTITLTSVASVTCFKYWIVNK